DPAKINLIDYQRLISPSIGINHDKKFIKMKTLVGIVVLAILITSCGPKPYYETSVGKKKLKHYNSLQFGQSQKN
ncbi:MAG TPA: hypothetical protein P5280_05425, partial [Cyclobacteriaceae bacterium]|nr:hypothetical protein [Cyclobacteriaceae bacterium]